MAASTEPAKFAAPTQTRSLIDTYRHQPRCSRKAMKTTSLASGKTSNAKRKWFRWRDGTMRSKRRRKAATMATANATTCANSRTSLWQRSNGCMRRRV